MVKVCNYCGYDQENEEDKRCECGGSFVNTYGGGHYSWRRDEIMAKRCGDLYDEDGSNNIDNILEWKRSRRKIHNHK